MTSPVIPTIFNGNPVDASWYNGVRDVITLLRTQTTIFRPLCRLRQSVAQSPANGTWTAISFDLEDIDDDPDGIGGHSTTTNTTRYTARYPGWYRCGGATGWSSNATGARGARWAVNGSTVAASEIILPTVSGISCIVPARNVEVYLATNDYVELLGYQGSGGALATNVGATGQSGMSIELIRNG